MILIRAFKQAISPVSACQENTCTLTSTKGSHARDLYQAKLETVFALVREVGTEDRALAYQPRVVLADMM